MMSNGTVEVFDYSTRYGTIGPARWQDIEVDLAAVGINIKAKMPPLPDRPRWLPAGLSVRDTIQVIAWHYGNLLHLDFKPPSQKQQAERLAETQAACEAALARLCIADLADDHRMTPGESVRNWIERRSTLRKALTAEIVELKDRIAALDTKANASAINAKTVRGDCWRELTQVWLALKPSGRSRRRHLQRFLRHCSTPIFGEVTETSIAAFVGHLSKCEQTNS
jgi:hypothetical protein